MSNTYKKIVVTKLSSNFREATKIQQVPIPTPKPSQLLVRNYYLGINASDINYTNGKYTKVEPPFDAGFEAIGKVAAVGSNVTKFKVGDSVLTSQYGSFAEYIVVEERIALPVPSANPEILPLSASGLTASIALEQVGDMKPNGETVLVTAAAGGTGQFAVQIAKLAGNHVIGTCSSDDKVEFLKKLGCNRVINYKKENLHEVLRKEYPSGVDIVYESVGGSTFETCVNNLAVHGRLIVIGMVSGYVSGTAWSGAEEGSAPTRPLPARLLTRSASVRGFFLNHFPKHFKKHTATLLNLYKEGKLKSYVDPTHFRGLEQVADAVEFLYKGKNIGKIVVDVSPSEGLKSKL